MVAPEIKAAARKRAHTRVVSLPGDLDVLCHDSAGAEYTLRWIHSEIYDEGAYSSFASQLEDGAVIFDVGCVGHGLGGWTEWMMGKKHRTIADTSRNKGSPGHSHVRSQNERRGCPGPNLHTTQP